MEKTLEQMTEELVKNGKVELPYIIIPEYDELKVLEKMFKRNQKSLLKDFQSISSISNILKEHGLKPRIFNYGIQTCDGSVREFIPMNSKLIRYSVQGVGLGLIHDDFDLKFLITPTALWLHHIEVKNKEKGFGTFLMNIILDVMDEFKNQIACVPTDIKGTQTELLRIRQFYSSFGFVKERKIIYRYLPK